MCSKCGNYRRHHRKGTRFQGWCVDCNGHPSPARKKAARRYEQKYTRPWINGKRVRILKDQTP